MVFSEVTEVRSQKILIRKLSLTFNKQKIAENRIKIGLLLKKIGIRHFWEEGGVVFSEVMEGRIVKILIRKLSLTFNE